jgi:tRNA1(Val) A37 N6-methylase TrmN6
LRFGGRFYCVYRPDRLIDLIAALRNSKLEPKRMTFVHADSVTAPSMVLLEAVSGGKCSLRITPPLLVYRDSETRPRLYSEDMQSILESGHFPASHE